MEILNKENHDMCECDDERPDKEEPADCGCTCENCLEGDHDNCEGEDPCDWTTDMEVEEDVNW